MANLSEFKKLKNRLLAMHIYCDIKLLEGNAYCLDITPAGRHDENGVVTHANKDRFEIITSIAEQILGSKGEVQANPKSGNIRITQGLSPEAARRIPLPSSIFLRPRYHAGRGRRARRRT